MDLKTLYSALYEPDMGIVILCLNLKKAQEEADGSNSSVRNC